ncbi:MAG TPA: hypothetical protein VGI99_13765 [Gemmataceae bacterium]|jgi:hypothetical protein
MIPFKKLLFAAAATLAIAAFDAGTASAQVHGYNTPFANSPRYPTFGSFLFRNTGKPALPTYQAAPWYTYWPYDAHFQTPAPINAPWIGPPVGGNFPVNPYFPAPAVQYAPVPGGPPPVGIPTPPPPAGIPTPYTR